MLVAKKLEKELNLAGCNHDPSQRKSTKPRALHSDQTQSMIFVITLEFSSLSSRQLSGILKMDSPCAGLSSVHHDWHGVFKGVIHKVTTKKHREIHLSKI